MPAWVADPANVARPRLNEARGRDLSWSVTRGWRAQRLGNRHGGWALYTDLLSAESVVYSFGVGDDATFDLALIERFGLTVHAFDPTPRAIDWVASQTMPRHFAFHPVGLASFDGSATFKLPPRPDWVSYSMTAGPVNGASTIEAPVKTLATLMNEIGSLNIDVLKLEIEGAEFAVIG